MKKYLFIIAAAAMCMLAACSKEKEQIISEENVPAVKHLPGWTYISALAGDESGKASIDGTSAAFSWNTGDRIAVFSGSTYHLSDALASNFDGTNSAEFAFDGDIEADRANFAIYPASLVLDGTSVRTGCEGDYTADYLTIMLPGSYTLAEVQDNVSPTPMIAVNAPGSGLSFKSVCALVRISVKNVPKDAACLKVCFPGKRVQGYFSLENFVAGTDGVIVEPSSDEGDDTITITDLGISSFTDLVVNVPVPTGVASSQEYLYVRVGAYDSTDHKINSIDTPLKVSSSIPTAWAPGRLASKKVTAKLPYFTCNTSTKKKVVLAPGNLQATIVTKPTSTTNPVGAGDNWRFAEHQYDALGDCSGNKFGNVGETIDLFAWIGTSATYSFADNEKYGLLWPGAAATYRGDQKSEAIKFSWADLFNGVSYPVNTWRLPKYDGGEWARIANTRISGDNYVSAKATIKDGEDIIARGLIIFPDEYTHPYGVKDIVSHTRDAAPASKYSDNIISLVEWDILEKVGGCAFLPVTSTRERVSEGGKYIIYTNIKYGDGVYWTDTGSSSAGGSANALIISDYDYCTASYSSASRIENKSVNRYNGCAVRLIRDVN